MANDVTTIEGVSTNLPTFVPGMALPAYLQNAAQELGSNLVERITVPTLSYKGKVWQIVRGKDEQKIQSRNAEGDVVPAAVMRVVILDLAQRRGRACYADGYDPTKPAQPDCWSSDGEVPDEHVKLPFGKTCKTCPKAVKGSKITDGREMAACAQHRILCVVSGNDIGGEPLRLKIAMTSDWDKDNTEHGWFAFQQYMDFTKANGIPHSAMLVTKMKFDNNAEYPKVLFGIDRFLSENELAQVKIAVANPKVADIIADKFTPAGSNGLVADQSDTKPDAGGALGKPSDPAHIAHEGTVNEVWWDGAAWIKPWVPGAAAQAAASAELVAIRKKAEDVANAAAVAKAEADMKAKANADADAKADKAAKAAATKVAKAAKDVAPAGKPKPTDAAHFANTGTEHEVWWDGAAWVKPWATEVAKVEPAAPPPPPPPPAPPAAELVTRPVPTDTGHFHARGTDAEMWWNGAEWEKPWATANAPAAGGTVNPAVAAADAALPADVTALMSKWG